MHAKVRDVPPWEVPQRRLRLKAIYEGIIRKYLLQGTHDNWVVSPQEYVPCGLIFLYIIIEWIYLYALQTKNEENKRLGKKPKEKWDYEICSKTFLFIVLSCFYILRAISIMTTRSSKYWTSGTNALGILCHWLVLITFLVTGLVVTVDENGDLTCVVLSTFIGLISCGTASISFGGLRSVLFLYYKTVPKGLRLFPVPLIGGAMHWSLDLLCRIFLSGDNEMSHWFYFTAHLVNMLVFFVILFYVVDFKFKDSIFKHIPKFITGYVKELFEVPLGRCFPATSGGRLAYKQTSLMLLTLCLFLCQGVFRYAIVNEKV